MKRVRRVILAGGTIVALIAAAAVSAVAAGGGFGQTPGQFTFADTNAFVNSFDPSGGASFFLSVDRGTFLFKPKGGGGFQRQDMTVLSTSIETQPDPTQPPVLVAIGCFLLTPANSTFSVSSDLQHATLNATLNPIDSCPFGPLVPVLGNTPIKAAGGGGGNFGFTYPLVISVTWTGTGAATESTDQGITTCQTLHALSHTDTLNAGSATVAVSISGFSSLGGPQVFGNVAVTHQVLQVTGSGIITPACGGSPG